MPVRIRSPRQPLSAENSEKSLKDACATRRQSRRHVRRRELGSSAVGLGKIVTGRGKKGWELDAEQLDWMKKAFMSQDSDDDGSLSLQELRGLWKVFFPYRTEEEINQETDRIFKDIDDDHNGAVMFEELFDYLKEIDEEEDEAFLAAPRTWRQWIWAVVGEYSGTYDIKWLRFSARAVTITSQCAILVSIINMMIESLPSYQNRDSAPGNVATVSQNGIKRKKLNTTTQVWVEATCIYVFTMEFVFRTISYPGTKMKYLSLTSTWIDLLSILPFYLTEFGILGTDDGSQSLMALRLFRTARPLLRALRYIRVLRVLKLGRHSAGVQLMMTSIVRARSSLWWLCLFTLMAMAMSSSLLYYAEKEEANFVYDEQAWFRDINSSLPDAGQKVFFQSIPDTMWWALVTLTTTGYGDTYPVTVGGKVVASLTMVAGLLVVGYPITILTAVFQDVHQEHLESQARKRRREILKDKLLESQLFAEKSPRAPDDKEELEAREREAQAEENPNDNPFLNLGINLGVLGAEVVSEEESSPRSAITPHMFLSEDRGHVRQESIPRLVVQYSGCSKPSTPRVVHNSRLSRSIDDQMVPLSEVNEMIAKMEKSILQHLGTFEAAIGTIRRDLDMMIKEIEDNKSPAPPSPPRAQPPPLPPLPPPFRDDIKSAKYAKSQPDNFDGGS